MMTQAREMATERYATSIPTVLTPTTSTGRTTQAMLMPSRVDGRTSPFPPFIVAIMYYNEPYIIM